MLRRELESLTEQRLLAGRGEIGQTLTMPGRVAGGFGQDHILAPPSDRLKELFGVVSHFFTRTRWDRTFLIVDSHYHYHPEPDSETSTSFSP